MSRMMKTLKDMAHIERIEPRVMLLIFNPKDNKGHRLVQRQRWHNPDQLTESYIEAVREVSSGFVNYQIVEQSEADTFPAKKTGFRFTSASFDRCVKSQGAADKENYESLIDYGRLFSDFDLSRKIKELDLDEIWLFGGPWMGFYEWNVIGPRLKLYEENMPDPGKTVYIMGFNYERRLQEMLEDLGHRTEGICYEVFVRPNPQDNVWDRFDGQRQRYDYWSNQDLDALPFETQNTHCGNVHFPPNARYHYQWDSREQVMSDCDDWLDYPKLTGRRKRIDCSEWGCDMLGHHKWWLRRIPRADGVTDGRFNNWWRYIADLDRSGFKK